MAGEVAQLLRERFLGGELERADLAQIAEVAESESSLFAVQEAIRERLEGLRPADFHYLIPEFRWNSIFTVNYDTIVEQAYEARANSRLQRLVLFLSNEDQIEGSLAAVPNPVPFVKLHGSITHARDSRIPLILTPDQYVRHRKGRENLFRFLLSRATDFPIVFAGHSLSDPDLRRILVEIEEETPSRPAYYFVARDVPSVLERSWASRRVFALQGTFEEFLRQIDQDIPEAQRRLASLAPITDVIERKFKRHEEMTDGCRRFLSEHVDVVDPSMSVKVANAAAFYRGFDVDWYAVSRGLDVKRSICDRMILEVMLRHESDRPTRVELYVLKGFAGSGKSVTLRRIAWDSAPICDGTVLHLREYGSLQYEAIVEVLRLTDERLFLFVDDAADNVSQIEGLIEQARRDKLALTIVTAERQNEWNTVCDDRLSPFLTDTFELRNLNEDEMTELLGKLEQHNSLGFMSEMEPADRLEYFGRVMRRQILVALHEATSGKPFVDILVDEFNQIRPEQARDIYLTVCVLNRLGVGVRAGVISRVFGIPFARFEQEFFKPLEHVVEVREHPTLGEMIYEARHQEIAQIVFERILTTRGARFDEYVRILRALNVSYNTDRRAYRGLLNNAPLADLFPEYEDVTELYRIAEEIAPDDAYRLQQQGIYEMKRRPPDLARAGRLLREAMALEPRNSSIVHSLAEHARHLAEEAGTELDKRRYRSEARDLLDSLIHFDGHKGYARHTLVKLAMDELKEQLEDPETPDERIERAVQRVEDHIQAGVQETPGDELMAQAEADLSNLLSDYDRALEALRGAHVKNPHNPVIAVRLAKQYRAASRFGEAVAVIERSLESNPHDKRLHYMAAMVKRQLSGIPDEQVIHHLQKSFVAGDTNYDAQFWLARYLFESLDGDRLERSRVLFSELREARIPFAQRRRVRDYLRNSGGERRRVSGTLIKKSDDYGFVHVDSLGQDVFVHASSFEDSIWTAISVGDRLELQVGFNLSGAVGLNISVAGNDGPP